ncbi:MAG TPA: hypothetical protein VE262_04375 [Blastocatellia bacterium]|nr:hypothetical protein [Blastocatellia bacterium]
METVITRDTDILREYIVALDARERGLSPFAKLAATVKLAQLRRELDEAHLETSDDDVAALRNEVDERLNRTFMRRFESKRWGARLSIFFMLVLGQQLVLALILLATMLFVRLAPVPAWWNPVLPREEPVFLYLFVFFFFFVTPMLALVVLFGGRYFRSWRVTIPATLLILALSVLGSWLTLPGKDENANPVQRSASLTRFAKDRGTDRNTYEDWTSTNWLMKDPKFQRDYEQFLRRGSGRWITSRFDANNDGAWGTALPVMSEYLDSGQDPESFREWLKYYFDRNRIYSEDRVEQEADALLSPNNQPFLGIWQVSPYLKERDERLYRHYMGAVNKRMKGFGLASLGLFTLIFLLIYLTGPALSFWERASGRMRLRIKRGSENAFEPDLRPINTPRVTRWKEQYYSFPERREIATPPFFDTPFRLLSRVHRSFVRLAVFTAILVFAFWGLVYMMDLAAGRENAPSQRALMRSHLLFGGAADRRDEQSAVDPLISDLPAGGFLPTVSADASQQNLSEGELTDAEIYALAATLKKNPNSREALLAARLISLKEQLDETDYENRKQFKEQSKIIENQMMEIDLLKSLTSQLEQTSATFPDQIAAAGSRAAAAEARAGQLGGEIAAATEKASSIEQQLQGKINEAETRAARAIEQIGKVEDLSSVLATRTEALEKELDRRAGQIEARTEELGERTAGLKEREERFARLQSVTFGALFAGIQNDVESLEHRASSTFNRFFNKGVLRRDAESLRERVTKLVGDLRNVNTDEAREMIGRLEELGKRVEAVAARVK